MTTPANPTPEPDGKPEDWSVLRYFIPPKPELNKIVVDVTQLRKENADLTQQLSDTRRRLAEVDKEREKDDATILRLIEQRNIAIADKTALRNAADGMRVTLQRIARWFGEFPELAEKWPDGSTMTYGAAYGSNGERDYMRQIAQTALAAYAALISEGVGS